MKVKKVKLVPFIRASKPQFNRTDAIIHKDKVVGLVCFSYGRSDTSDMWSVWDISVKLPLLGLGEYHRMDPPMYSTYTQCKKAITDQIEEILEGDEYTTPENWTEVNPEYEAEGSCPYLTGRIWLRRPNVEPEWTMKPLVAPLHEDLTLSVIRCGSVTIK